MLLIIVLTFCTVTISATDLLNFPHVSGPPNFIYRKFYNCADKPTPINFTAAPRWLNETYQVIDADVYFPIPVGNNLKAKVAAYAEVQNKWVHVVNMSDKVCQVLHFYVGPNRKVFLTPVGLSPDTCPIPQGVYHARNIHFDMRDSRVPTFPYGLFKMLLALHDVNDVLQLCLGILFDNKPY